MPSIALEDDPRVMELRDQLPALARHTYLNTGTAGPLSRAVIDAVAAQIARERDEGRVRPAFEKEFVALLDRARALMAASLDVQSSDVALTGSTGEGLNIVLYGLAWRPGDEIITTGAEHESGLLPLGVLRQRHGVTVRVVPVPYDTDGALEAVAAALNARTRLVVLSHVSYATGSVLPLAELVALAHRHGVPVLADGAQSFAAIPLDLPGSGVDFYAVSGQKWLGGPEGTGALYVRRAALDLLAPTFIGYLSVAACDAEGHFLPQPGARRFEVGTRYLPAIAGQAAAVEWWHDAVGPEWAYARIHGLAERLIAGLSEVRGVEVITPCGTHAGLVSFQIPGGAPEAVVARLTDEHDILCRAIPWTPWVRLSTGWYTTVEEVDRAVRAVAEVSHRLGASS